jgi:coatomer subunit beta
MDFLGDSNNPSAVDVISFVREVVEKFPDLRPAITEKLVSTFGEIKSGKVFRGAMWIVGEYCTGGPGKLHLSCGINIADSFRYQEGRIRDA